MTVTGHAKRRMVAAMPPPDLMDDVDLVEELADLRAREAVLERRWFCDRVACDGLPHLGWLHKHARASQHPPAWSWRTWMLLTGRGWGKTRTAAELVRAWAEKPDQFICVIARTETLVREICFESTRAGLLAVIPPELIRAYHSSTGNVELILTNGTVIRGFGAEVPDNLRGWAFDKGWCDEYAAWNRHVAQDVMNMLWFCLREAVEPQVVISTTPKALPHIKKLVERSKSQWRRIAELIAAKLGHDPGPKVVLTSGTTDENRANLSADALEELDDQFAGTRLGQQELGGVVLEDVEGALWQTWMFEVEGFRIVDRSLVEPLDRIVIGVDPATTSTEQADETGIAVCGRGGWRDRTFSDERPRGYVLESSASKMTPIQTMTRVAKLYHQWKADAVILEANNGGEYLSTVLQMVDPTVNYRIVHATRDKRARATPVAGLYEQQRIHHVGPVKDLDELETVMTSYTGAPESQEKSPDILDAMVWAMTDLFLDPETTTPRRARDSRSEGRR